MSRCISGVQAVAGVHQGAGFNPGGCVKAPGGYFCGGSVKHRPVLYFISINVESPPPPPPPFVQH